LGTRSGSGFFPGNRKQRKNFTLTDGNKRAILKEERYGTTGPKYFTENRKQGQGQGARGQ
jgi:hypothetical protein